MKNYAKALGCVMLLSFLFIPLNSFGEGTVANKAATKKFSLSIKDNRLNIQAENINFKEILKEFGEKAGIKVEIFEGVEDKKVSINIKALPISAANVILEKMSVESYAVAYDKQSLLEAIYVLPKGKRFAKFVKGKNVVGSANFTNKNPADSIKGREIAATKQGIRYVKDEVILKFHLGVSEQEIDEILKKYKLIKIDDKTLSKIGYIKTRTIGRKDAIKVVKEIRKEYKVKVPELNYISDVLAVNDPFYGNQWYVSDISFDKAWDKLTSKKITKVAVIDSGVDAKHPDLKEKILDGYDFVNNDGDASDDHGHGTFVTGIISATANDIGIKGLYDYARIIPVKVIDKNGLGTYEDVAKGIIFAVDKGAKVVNLSLGGYAYSFMLQEAVDYALEKGCIVVAAGGNDGIEQEIYPAAYPDVIGVAALDYDGQNWSDSNSGKHIDVSAPGVNIISTGLNGSYVYASGTSTSTAMVSALAAMLKSEKPNLSSSSIEKVIIQTAKDLGEKGWDKIYGKGEINALAALEQTVEPFHDVAVRSISIEPLIFEKGKPTYIVASIENAGTYKSEKCDVILYEIIGEKKKEIAKKEAVTVLDKTKIVFAWKPARLMDKVRFEAVVSAKDDKDTQNNSKTTLAFLVREKTNLYILYANVPPVHQWIAYQAYKRLPAAGSLQTEMADYMGPKTDDDPLLSDAWLPSSEWDDDGNDSPYTSSTAIIEGAWEEDEPWYRSLDHFWDPDLNYNTNLSLITEYDSPAEATAKAALSGLCNSALEAIQNRFKNAVDEYKKNNKSKAYWWLGRTAHLLMDMSVPAHAMLDMHANIITQTSTDSYEQFTAYSENYKKIKFNSPNTTIPDYTSLGDFPKGDFHGYTPPGYNKYLTRLMYNLAEYGDNYDSDDYPGEVVHGYNYWPAKNDLTKTNGTVTEVEEVLWPGIVVAPLSEGSHYEIHHVKDSQGDEPYRIFYYQDFFNIVNNSAYGVKVTYSNGASEEFYDFNEIGFVHEVIPSSFLERWHQKGLESRAIGYVAALYQLFWDATHINPPTLVSPGSNSEPGIEISTTTPTFQWSTVNNATRYGLYISKYPYGPSNIIYSNTSFTATSFPLPNGYLINGGKYRWNMTAFNNSSESGVSNTLYFTVNVPATLSYITISGATEINEGSGAQYTCTAYYSDSSSSNVTNSASWDENSAYASINNTGYLSTLSVPSDQTCQITTTYGGKSDTHDITIKNIPVTLSDIWITGVRKVNEDSGAQYTCTVSYSDGSTYDVTNSASWSVDSIYATINNTGYFTTSLVSSNSLCNISVTYEGQSDSMEVTINNYDILYVPDNYSTIQAAIDAAPDGCEIIVRAGTYKENIKFKYKDITVRSESGADQTIIDGNANGSVVTFDTDYKVKWALDGFTIANGSGTNIEAPPYIYNYGGGIYIRSSSPTISNCVISSNSAIDGGGIYINNSSPQINNCIIRNNTADTGGGIKCLSGSSSNLSSPVLTNCIIDSNTDGAIDCLLSSLTIINCTINGNTSGISCHFFSSLTVVNSILWGNNSNEISIDSYSSIDITYSDVQQNLGIYPGEGNINAVPLFVGGSNYHLTANSPCIDTGTNVDAPSDDIDGNSRPQDTGYDMGAYEYIGNIVTCPIYVPTDYPTIQTAIVVASTGCEIIVKDGTYTENINFLGKAITVRSENGAATTTINGNASGSVATFDSGEGANSVLDGFTITNGSGTLIDSSNRYGGGIYCNSSSPIISNCVITGNSVNEDGGGLYCLNYSSPLISDCVINNNSSSDDGGGIFCYQSSSPTIVNSIISGNSGSDGGGIYCGWESSPDITDSSIISNSASQDGGGIYCWESSSPSITNCTITGNSAVDGGGGVYCYYSSPTIINCSINANSAGDDGGGILCHSSSKPLISNCTINNNTAGSGGGIACSSSPTITKCIISGNSATYRDGGGILLTNGSPTITNCIISGNLAARWGGGILGIDSETAITNSTISGNFAGDAGGGIYCGYYTEMTMVNSILWGDRTVSGSNEIHLEDDGTIAINYSDIEGGWKTPAEMLLNHNINANPSFINQQSALNVPTSGGDYHLKLDSPCINEGTDDSIIYSNLPVDDIDGGSRPQEAGYDMGADEVVYREIVLQPGPGEGKDIWTTSVYSYTPEGDGPGGGLDDHELRVGGWSDLCYSLIQFNLTGLPTYTTSAVLYLYNAADQGSPTGMYLDRITEFWDWRTQGTGLDRERLWWADRPSATQWIPGSLPAPTVGQWCSIDITDLYNAWQDGTYPNYGIQLRPTNSWNRWNEFYSSDYMGDISLRPKLVITPGDEFIGPNDISLTTGWNLISLPQQPSDTTIESVLSSISDKYASVWSFKNSAWKVYDPANPGFSDLTNMEAGWGYWVNMNEAATLTVSGSSPSNAISLVSGWNLVGYNSGDPQPVADALASIAGKYMSVWAFMNGSWKVYDPSSPGFSDLLTMEPNYGYWINTTQVCDWTLP